MDVLYRDGDSIFYDYIVADKDYEALIFIHGVGLDLSTWDTFIPVCQHDYNILRYDLRGHGNSARGNKKIVWETFYEDLLFIVETLNIQTFHLVGHGFGCNVATKFALINPDIVKSLILLSFASIYPTASAEKIGDKRKKQYHVESMASVGKHVIESATMLPKNSPEFTKLAAPYQKVSAETYFQIFHLMMQSKSPDYLQNLYVPSLVLAGAMDPIYPSFLSSISALYLPTSQFLVVPNASNMMYVDQPEVTFQWIHEFISDVPINQFNNDNGEIFSELRSKFQTIFKEGEKKINAANELKINLLNGFRVFLNGEEILEGWNQRNAKQILIYLVFHRTVIREQLCDELWPDISLKKSRNNLRVYLSHLKKLLDYEGNKSHFLVMDHEHVNLQGRIKCDCIDFFEDVEKAYREEEKSHKSILVQRIFEHAPKNLFQGLYENWFLEQREKLEKKLFDLAHWMGDFYVDRNDLNKAMEFYRIADQYCPGDFSIEYKTTKLQKERNNREKDHYHK